mgnify:FL=1
MVEEISFQKEVGELMIDLSLFVNKINPNPFIALAVIEIFKNKMIDRYIFGNERPVKITNREVRDLYDQLQIFFKRYLSSS